MHLLFSVRVRFVALGAIGLLLALAFSLLGLFRHSPPQATVLPLPQDPLIQVYFNHSPTATYTDPYRQQSRSGDDLEQVIVEAIESAQRSIALAVHELNLPRVAQALAAKQQSGVSVRVIVENSYRTPLSRLTPAEVERLDERSLQKYEEFVQWVDRDQNGTLSPDEIAQGDALVILDNAQVPVIDDTADGSKGSDLMHHKFMVIDGAIVVIGSANFTLSDIHGDFANPDSRGNANHLLQITSPDLADLLLEEFDLMWGRDAANRPSPQGSLFGLQKPYRPPQTITLAPNSTITLQLSPTSRRLPWEQSSNGLIRRTLQRAQHQVDLMLFVFSEQTLSDALELLHRKGIPVRALIESSFIYRNYSEALDLMGVALPDDRCRYEADNHPWQTPIATVGTPDLPEGDLLHHKVGIVDDRLVITGSQNWSAAANESNDENLLVIDNPTVAAHFRREFDQLYQTAILGLPTRIQEKIQSQAASCPA